MKILIDQRENGVIDKYKRAIQLEPKYSENIEMEVSNLTLGDIIVCNNVSQETYLIIERKTVSDLLASIKDGRYKEQSLRLANSSQVSSHQIVYLLEGDIPVQHKKIIYSTLTSLSIFKGFSIMRTSSMMETVEWLLAMVDKIYRSLKNNKQPYFLKEINQEQCQEAVNYCNVIKSVKKDNINKDNIGEIMLMQLPGISATIARAILSNFDGFTDFIRKINEDASCLNGMTYESSGKVRKIGKNCIDSIKYMLID